MQIHDSTFLSIYVPSDLVVVKDPEGCGLTPPLTTALNTAASALLALLTWLLRVLLALLSLSLALIGGGMHAGASAIGLGAGLVAVAAHG
jgi:hypothetical protein